MIAACWWRKARVLRAENGEIRKRLDTLAMDRELRNSEKDNLALALSAMNIPLFVDENQADQHVSRRDRWSAMQVAQTDLERHPLGLSYLHSLLLIAKSEIARDGYISENIRKRIFSLSCFSDYLFAVTCLAVFPQKQKWRSDHLKRLRTNNLTQNRPISSPPLLTFAWKGLARWSVTRPSARASEQTRRREASACRPRRQPTTSSATKLTWTGNFIAPWTNWSVYKGSDEEKTCRLLSTSIWEEGDNLFCQTKPRSALFSIDM